jgi:hypothetical protein
VTVGKALSTVGLSRPTRRRGFCPACRLWDPGSNDRAGRAEISAPAVVALAFLALSAIAWVLTIRRSENAGMDMGMGSLGSFAAGWTVMTAAMMLPTALPLVFEFARRSEGRRLWRAATGVLAMTYLSIWLAFGLACYAALRTFPIPEAEQGAVGGVALALAGLYGLTPRKASSEARCRELYSLHGPLPFSVVRTGMVAGARYGLSCVGCSAGLMVAMAIIGHVEPGLDGDPGRRGAALQARTRPDRPADVAALGSPGRDGRRVRVDGIGRSRGSAGSRRPDRSRRSRRYLPQDQARARIDAALTAGGRIVKTHTCQSGGRSPIPRAMRSTLLLGRTPTERGSSPATRRHVLDWIE